MQSVYPFGRFIKSTLNAGSRAIGGFSILIGAQSSHVGQIYHPIWHRTSIERAGKCYQMLILMLGVTPEPQISDFMNEWVGLLTRRQYVFHGIGHASFWDVFRLGSVEVRLPGVRLFFKVRLS